MTTITLSKRQIKAADRIGGIELMILWPDSLGPEPDLDPDHELEAMPREKAAAEQMVRAACEAHNLIPVHVRVATLLRPPAPYKAARQVRAHLAVTIIGRRWVHASTKSRGRVAYAQEPQ